MPLSLCPLAQWEWGLELLPRSAVYPSFKTGRGVCMPVRSCWATVSWGPDGATCRAACWSLGKSRKNRTDFCGVLSQGRVLSPAKLLV